MTLEHKTLFRPAFDKRDPDPKKNYGIHNMEMTFAVIGPKGAVVWTISTGWYCKSAREHLFTFPPNIREGISSTYLKPWATDLGYHAIAPQYEDHYPRENCHLLKGKTCYYDGSSLNGDNLVEDFLTQGDEWLWAKLEEYYRHVYEGGSFDYGEQF